MYDVGDILLFALSGKRQIKWGTFKQYFEEVYRRSTPIKQGVSDNSVASHRNLVLRALSCLGHIDWHSDTGEIEVVVAPPTIASLPVLGSSRAILCGARSPGTVGDLKRAAEGSGVRVIVSSQTGISPYAPAQVELQGESTAAIQGIADSIGIRYLEVPPARLLAHGSASLVEYTRGLVWSNDRELNWPRQDFKEDRVSFRGRTEPPPRRRLSRYQSPITSTWHFRLWRDSESAEVDLDWGRYAVASESSLNYLLYIREKRSALVPLGAPLPPLLARAFGLCSGRWPALVENPDAIFFKLCYEFSDVPPSVFNSVGQKLGMATTMRG